MYYEFHNVFLTKYYLILIRIPTLCIFYLKYVYYIVSTGSYHLWLWNIERDNSSSLCLLTYYLIFSSLIFFSTIPNINWVLPVSKGNLFTLKQVLIFLLLYGFLLRTGLNRLQKYIIYCSSSCKVCGINLSCRNLWNSAQFLNHTLKYMTFIPNWYFKNIYTSISCREQYKNR